MLYPTVGYRFGGKTLLQEAGLSLAVDYGASLYLSNVGVDTGLLASVPFPEGDIYSGLRGFGSLNWVGTSSLSAALTLGVIRQLETHRAFVEVTLSTGRYDEYGPKMGVAPTGIIVTPAIGFTF